MSTICHSFCVNAWKHLLGSSARMLNYKRLKYQHVAIVLLLFSFILLVVFITVIQQHEYWRRSEIEQDFMVEIGNRKFYFGIRDYVTWYEAKVKCNEVGMQLVTLDTKKKYYMILNWIRENPVYDDWLWTGGFKSSMTSQWEWMTSRSNFSYTSWGLGQPSRNLHLESCMDFSLKSMGWEDDGCTDVLLSYLCEQTGEEAV